MDPLAASYAAISKKIVHKYLTAAVIPGENGVAAQTALPQFLVAHAKT